MPDQKMQLGRSDWGFRLSREKLYGGATEGRGPQQKQQASMEGRGPQQQKQQPPATEGRGGGQRKQEPQGTEGRAGGQQK